MVVVVVVDLYSCGTDSSSAGGLTTVAEVQRRVNEATTTVLRVTKESSATLVVLREGSADCD